MADSDYYDNMQNGLCGIAMPGRGGVTAMIYIDDAEWTEHCASQNNQLTY